MKRYLSNQPLLLASGLILSVLASYSTFRAVPAFSGVFKSFGRDLPLVTELLLKFYPALLAVPATVLLAWHFWPRREQRGLAALLTAVAGAVAMPLVVVLSMYLPIVSLPR